MRFARYCEPIAAQILTRHAIREGRILGKISIGADEPRERVDAKIQEPPIYPDLGQKLALSVRLDSFVQLKLDSTSPPP